MDTLVPGCQYSRGRQCTSVSLNQCHAPSTCGSVTTSRARSAAARSGIFSSNPTTTGWPTPYVDRSASSSPALARRYGRVRLAGLTVVNGLSWVSRFPSDPVAAAVNVYRRL
jgi:hypothetical protein